MMACIQFLLLFCSFIYIFNVNPSCAQIPNSPIRSLVLPVTKDPATFQYLTTIYHGTSPEPVRVVLDLGCPSLWLDCSSGRLSSSRRRIPSCSIQCPAAKPNNMSCASSAAMPKRKCTACGLSTENSITRSATRGELVEDSLTVQSVDGSKSGPVTTVDHFLFSCAPGFLLNRLARGAQGMLGLGRSRIALPSQLASKFGLQRKFATCLSTDGLILFGEPGYDSIFGKEISRSLMYTPLLTSPDGSGSSQDYSINVKSIKINGKRLSLRQKGIGGGTKISTTVPYTTLESSIYSSFIEAYKEAATNNYFLNMTLVAPVAPFGLCFSSKEVPSSMLLGPMVPAIDLVLQSEMVKWRVHGRNAMVPVLDEVMCLGFLDGGFKSKTSSSIVIGGFQLEDNLLEFNLGTSMLGFSSSLLTRHTSCSDYHAKMMQSTLKDSL
ncbi:aspartic proteinase GIP2 [Populus alba x Populus x berolinensis]|nr:aspartic proteinase GIP2 [Populus alba x Populus x berolinensis]